MRLSSIILPTALAGAAIAAPFDAFSHPNKTWPHGVQSGPFIDWKTFKGNGVNLGAWLEKEKGFDPVWWNATGGANAADEWTLCEILGSRCSAVFEARYASFLNTTTIDKLASVGVNVLRIPTTYAAWIKVPGSQLYHGRQQDYLRTISRYAIERYGMHVIIGLHSLPGGTNGLDIGEAVGHYGWFYNTTNLDYSLQAIDGILDFIQHSGHINAFTIAPLNEASDNNTLFGTNASLSDHAATWITKYIHLSLDHIARVDSRIPLMFQDCFKGAAYWAPFFNASANLVFDAHLYQFPIPGSTPQNTPAFVCGRAAGAAAAENKFPIFVGEWSLQTYTNNTFAGRQNVFNAQRYAWQKYLSGSTFWTAISYGDAVVEGQGVQKDYWSYIDLINEGVISAPTDQENYCQ